LKTAFFSKIGCKNRGYSQKKFLFFGLNYTLFGVILLNNRVLSIKKLHRNYTKTAFNFTKTTQKLHSFSIYFGSKIPFLGFSLPFFKKCLSVWKTNP